VVQLREADVDVGDLNYDLAATRTQNDAPAVRDTGVDPAAGALVVPQLDETSGAWPIALAVAVAVVVVVLAGGISARPGRGRRPEVVRR